MAAEATSRGNGVLPTATGTGSERGWGLMTCHPEEGDSTRPMAGPIGTVTQSEERQQALAVIYLGLDEPRT